MAKKILTKPQHETSLLVKEVAAPATPSAGYVEFYVKADGRAYIKDDAGNELLLMPASGTSKITVGTSAPASPTAGDLWIDTN